MVRGLGSFIAMSVLLLAAGWMAGYIYGGVQWTTSRAIARGISAFWWATGALFISGILYRVIFNRLSAVCGILFCVTIAVALVLTGFHDAVGRW
ncbi:hypothetical protein N4224_04220 [Yersinia enterocolitica]|nr:hypothetical protein [Yersinia enterocolitica]AJJ25237.1 putative membrane protein [Yersinia enterocolitica]UYJ85924.1 hypothetical protein N4W04_04215 [Yersinia enterocolitica]UYK15305.1 hypothetical protein N4224_04220 [Yersinia enterocolitica]CRY25824.1 putative inner membrane protein [Yersinia enterocolitica]HDY4894717.1 hypothetical protein [Yersinia enterocolitica]